MRVSKIFLPLALAASAIATGSAANAGPSLASINQKSTEIIAQINSFSPSDAERVAAQIASDLKEFAVMGVDILNRQDPCDRIEFHLFMETADQVLNAIIQNADHIALLGPFIAPILRKWDDFLDAAFFAIISNVQNNCPPQEIGRLGLLEKHVKQAEQSLDTYQEVTVST